MSDATTTGRVVRFRAIGRPYPQGSKSAFVANGKGGKAVAVMKESSGRGHSSWRNAVSEASLAVVERDLHGVPLAGALRLDVTFRFSMPTSRPRWQHVLGRIFKTTEPDLSKLVRAVEDAFQAAGLIDNDSRIAMLVAAKYEYETGWQGATFRIEELPDSPDHPTIASGS